VSVLGLALAVAAAPGALGDEDSGATALVAADDGTPSSPAIVREAVGRRTANSRTFTLDDGRMLTRVYPGPVNFEDAQGAWREIDVELAVDGAGGYGVGQAGFDLRLPANLDQATPVEMTTTGGAIGFAPEGMSRSTAEIDGNRALYRSVFAGVDLEYVTRPTGLKESLLLARPEAARDFVFSLDTGGLRPVERPSGGIAVLNAEGGVEFAIAPPFMRDAAGAVSRGVRYELRERGSRWALAVLTDRDWLNDPRRRYPVEIDPSVDIAPQSDCYLDSGSPTTSFCTDDELAVGWDGSHDHRAIMKFDVGSVVPKGARVEESWVAHLSGAEDQQHQQAARPPSHDPGLDAVGYLEQLRRDRRLGHRRWRLRRVVELAAEVGRLRSCRRLLPMGDRRARPEVGRRGPSQPRARHQGRQRNACHEPASVRLAGRSGP
jgi:hypothetical protein